MIFVTEFPLRYSSLCLILFACSSFAIAQESEKSSEAEELFVHRVLPLLKEKCNTCHGDDQKDVRGGLDTRSLSGLLKGGESGEPSLIRGDAKNSPLFQAVTRASDYVSAMPPKENDKLTPEQVDQIKQWIDAGAPWPSDERIASIRQATEEKWNVAGGVRVATSGGLADDWTNRLYEPENLWAYQPPQKPSLSTEVDDARMIDALIDRKLQELELTAAPAADRRTLIRRATFDLIGLPPKPEEVEDFVNDPRPDEEAFADVVERLLASPHYGEQWAQHWLDVVRYADSSGFANDYERGNAWRYRDYVVRAFNTDKPYHQFILEQIAGDELNPDDPEMLIAVGFLRMGPWELTGMEVAKVARQRFLDDVTDAVGQVFLGHMLQCAKCHDHKFDPIPTRDYYSIQAAFATTQLAERQAPFLDVENTNFLNETKYLNQRRKHYNELLKQVNNNVTLEAAREWYADNSIDPDDFEKTVASLREMQNGKDPSVNDVRKQMQKDKVDPAHIPPRHVGFAPEDFGLERIGRKGLSRLEWRMDRYEPYAFSVYTGRTPQMKSVYAPLRMPNDPMKQGELEQTCILTGGDPFSPAEPVEPGVLSIVNKMLGDIDESQTPNEIPIQGRRQELAEWIASEKNPLTARVMVNRIWQWHFGTPIAGNPNNFGATGKKPTHPELLDWLALEFMERGWSVKEMHRLIMKTAAYRRASSHPNPKELAAKDPESTSDAVFQPRRLTAEEIRDATLAVTGELNPKLGGIPIRPEMNLEAALQPRMVMGTFAEAWQPSPLPEQRHRRSIYTMKIRGQRDPFFEVFNSPSPDLSCEARDTSTVTPQVFAMFNSEIVYDRALALANRMTQQHGIHKNAEIIQDLFQRLYGRSATQQEVELCLNHWEEMKTRHESINFEPPHYPDSVVRDAVEENTGTSFQFEEPLEVYADFVPDLKPADVGPVVRGLAEVCLVLLNSNEFNYVY